MANVKVFYKYLTLRKVNVKVKVRFMCGKSEVLVVRSVVCKYERNPSRNEKVMANVKFFYKYLTLRKVNEKVKVRFVANVKVFWNGRTVNRQADSYIPFSNFVCGGIIRYLA